MCLCVSKPADKILSRDILERGFAANDDGAGFAYARNGKLIVKKGFFDFQSFWKSFCQIQKGNPVIIHFRLRSSGALNEENCHPFLINDSICIAHNGSLEDWTGNEKSKKSDTLWFVESILKPLFEKVPDAHLNPVFVHLLEKTIGVGNKMVFLDSQGHSTILRAWVGETFGGCWFSNESFKTPIKEESIWNEEDWEPQEQFKPKSPTEQILGARSQLGETKPKMKSGSTKGYDSTRFVTTNEERAQTYARGIGRRGDQFLERISTGREENLEATRKYLEAARNQDMDKMEKLLTELDPRDVRQMMC